jgi:hypothetical protein
VISTSELLHQACKASAKSWGLAAVSFALLALAIAPGPHKLPHRLTLTLMAGGGSYALLLARQRELQSWQLYRGYQQSPAPYWLGQRLALAQATHAYQLLCPPQRATPPTLALEPEPPPETNPYAWLAELLHYPSVLVYGPPGSGKSTLAEWLVYQRTNLGHEIEVLDPHRAAGQWAGLPCYGDGLDYESIDARLGAFRKLVRERYQIRSEDEGFNPTPLTVLAEEFTQWATHCENSADFFAISVSDIRKVGCHVVYVSHARTLTGLGGAKGLAKTRDSALLEVQLFAQVDPLTGRATPTGHAEIRYPGGETTPVRVPNLSNRPNPTPARRFEGSTRTGSTGSSRKRVLELRSQGRNQGEIIRAVWGVSKGNSAAYREALTRYREAVAQEV